MYVLQFAHLCPLLCSSTAQTVQNVCPHGCKQTEITLSQHILQGRDAGRGGGAGTVADTWNNNKQYQINNIELMSCRYVSSSYFCPYSSLYHICLLFIPLDPCGPLCQC